MQEFYFRDVNDPKYNKGQFETASEDEALFSNIKLIVTTKFGDVLGSPTFGNDEDDLLFTKRVNHDSIRTKIYNAINKFSFIGRRRSVKVNTTVMSNGKSDTIVANIMVDGKNFLGFALD